MKIDIFQYETFLKEAWQLFKKEWGFFIIAILIFLIIEMIDITFGYVKEPTGVAAGNPVVTVITMILSLILSVGFTRSILAYVSGENLTFKTFFAGHKPLGPLIQYAIFGVAFLVAIRVLFAVLTAGLDDMRLVYSIAIPLILYFLIRLMFVQFLIIDKSMNAFDAVRKSWDMTSSELSYILFFTIFFVVLNILALLPFFLVAIAAPSTNTGIYFSMSGLFVTVPIAMIAYALLYKKTVMKDRSEKQITEKKTYND